MFQHQRHKPVRELQRPRELIVACAPMRSNVNISRIVRACGCCAIERVICCDSGKVIDKIARDGADAVKIEKRRTLAPVLVELKNTGHHIVALEQTTGSIELSKYKFLRKTVLVVGNERCGLTEEILQVVDDVVEIPVFGLPHSHNAATATAIAMYEYCRQFPEG
jgi:tRNA G18 (ribose-2'-O)-methylase SpoU